MEVIAGVLTDLDATAMYRHPETGQDVISPAVQDVFLKARAVDMPIMPATSRSLSLTKEFIYECDVNSLCLLDNGASIYDPKEGVYREKLWLPGDTIRTVGGGLLEFCTSISSEEDYNPLSPTELAKKIAAGWNADAPSVFAEFPNDPAVEGAIFEYLTEQEQELGISFKIMNGDTAAEKCVQVNLAGVSKGPTASRILRMTGLEGKRNMAIGDNTQDHVLFDAVNPPGSVASESQGLTVAMGNATLELKRQANYDGAHGEVPDVWHDGFAWAVDTLALPGHKKKSDWKYIPSADDPVNRPKIDAESAQAIERTLEAGSVKVEALQSLISTFEDARPLDAMDACRRFSMTLKGQGYKLYWSDLDLQRPCWGIEHAIAVLKRSEQDHAPLFYDKPLELTTLRLVNILQDVGKSLAIAETGTNEAQTEYNVRVAEKILADLDIPDAIKVAVPLLIAYDGTGHALQNMPYHEKLAELRKAWPQEMAGSLDDLLIAIYISDASAHSSYNDTLNPRAHMQDLAVPQGSNLTFLFARHPNGSLTLTPDRCKLLQKIYKHADAMLPLITPDPELAERPFPSDAEIFNESIAKKFELHPDRVTTGVFPNQSIIQSVSEIADGSTVTLRMDTSDAEKPATSLSVTQSTAESTSVTRYFIRQGNVWRQEEVRYHAENALSTARQNMVTEVVQVSRHPEDVHGDAQLSSSIRDISTGLQTQLIDFGQSLQDMDEMQRLLHIVQNA